MPTYAELKDDSRRFVAFTGPTAYKFELLLPAFEQTYLKKYPASQAKTGKARKRRVGADRKGLLASIEEKLLFALVHQKSCPMQSIRGELFGMGRPQANEWIHTLLPVLKQALDNLDMSQNGNQINSKGRSEIEAMRLIPSVTILKDFVRD